MTPIISNKAVIQRIHDLTGLSMNNSRMAFSGTMKAVADMLAEGQKVNLWAIGTLSFRRCVGRYKPEQTITSRGVTRIIPANYQQPTWALRFTSSKSIRRTIRQKQSTWTK